MKYYYNFKADKKIKLLFEIEFFSDIMNVFTDTFDQFKSLLKIK